MAGPEVIDFAREGIFLLLKLAGPLMLVGLVVGVLIALFQALTQIQEMTLVFVPKIVAVFLMLIVTLPFMGQALAGYMDLVIAHIIAG